VFAEFFVAYDASGSENDHDGTLVVVGLVAAERKWNRFEQEWQAVLDRFEVPYFHMTELNHRASGTGAYAKWKDDDQGLLLRDRAYRSAAKKRGTVRRFEDYGEVLTDLAKMLPQRALIQHRETPLAMCEANPDKCPKRC